MNEDKINTTKMSNTNSVNEARTIGEIVRELDTITVSNYEVEVAIIKGLLNNGFIVNTKPIMVNGHQTGNIITVSKIEKVFY